MLVYENDRDILALGELLKSLLDSRQWGFYGIEYRIACEFSTFLGVFATNHVAGNEKWMCVLLASTTKKFFF